MPKIKVDDLNLYYEIHGEGFPLVMIMGISGDAYWWDSAVINELSKEFKTIIFDHIGIGRSDGPARTQIKKMADDTVGLMNALDIEKAHVFGISMGGMIAQLMAINYPQRVLTLTSWMSTYYFPDPDIPASTEEVAAWFKQKIKNPAKTREEIIENGVSLAVAPYYGCQIVRPFTEKESPDIPVMIGA